MPRNVLHHSTVINTTFCLYNGEGDLVKSIPVRVDVPELRPEAFPEVYRKLVAIRDQLEQEVLNGKQPRPGENSVQPASAEPQPTA